MDPAKLATSLQEIEAELPGILTRLKAARKMLDICAAWDGDPQKIDLEAFTIEEAEIAFDEITSHEEYWRNQPLQVNNAYALIVTAMDLPRCLLALPPLGKKVGYI